MKGVGTMKSLLSLVLCLVFTVVAQAQTALKPPTESALDRFLRYVRSTRSRRKIRRPRPSTQKAARPGEPAGERAEGTRRAECSRQRIRNRLRHVPGNLAGQLESSGRSVYLSHGYLAGGFGRKRQRDHPQELSGRRHRSAE